MPIWKSEHWHSAYKQPDDRSRSRRKPSDLWHKKGFDPQYGARSLRRTLQEYVEDPLCDLLLEGENGESILVELDEANDRLKVKAVTTA